MTNPYVGSVRVPMSVSALTSHGAESAVLDGAGTVQTDIPCRKCGYNLRSLNAGGRCPECGSPVGLSVQGNLLRFADPNWLMGLRKGVNFILVAVLVSVIVVICGAFARRVLPPLVTQFASLGSGVLFVIGGWLVTEPDPSGLGEHQYGTVRKLIRVALLVNAAQNLMQIVLHLAPLDPSLALTLSIISILASLVGVVGQFAQLSYLSKLALRIPDPSLSGRAWFLMWAIGISYGVLILMVLAVFLGVRAARTGGGGFGGLSQGPLIAFGCFAVVVLIVLIVFGIMYLLMLSRFGKAFEQQAAMARQVWDVVQ